MIDAIKFLEGVKKLEKGSPVVLPCGHEDPVEISEKTRGCCAYNIGVLVSMGYWAIDEGDKK